MNDFEMLDWIVKELDRVPCEPRLYPARLWALQVHLNRPIETEISRVVVEPLAQLTDDAYHAESSHPLKYRFSEFTAFSLTSLSSTVSDTPDTWAWQCVRDLAVFGLREAIAYFHTYNFIKDASGFIRSGIDLYHELAELFLTHVDALAGSKQPAVKRLLQFVEAYGEGFPQNVQKTV